MMKNLFYFRGLVLLVVFLTGWNVAAAYDFEEGGIFYNVNDDGASVTVTFESTSYNSYSGNVVIPDFVSHDGTTYTVTAIGEYAFLYCTDLTSIVISDSVNTVGRAAFWSCTGLRNVTIGKSITTLRYKKGSAIFYAFQNCDSITSLTWNAVNCADNGNMGTTNFEQVTFGPEVQVIPPNIAKKSKISEVVIPNSVTTIGNSAFENIFNLQTVTLGNSVTTIGSSAFANCELLLKVVIPDATTNIGASAFANCHWLIKVVMGNSVTNIGNSAFENCSNLRRIDIPNSVVAIGNSAFAGCELMTEVTMGNSVTTIGEGAFSGCIGIEEITIPNSVTQIQAGAFFNCSNLSKVNISSLEAWCDIVFGEWEQPSDYYEYEYTSNPLYSAHHLFLNGQEVTDLVIPESVTAINSYVFYGGSGFTSVTLGDAVTTIGYYAFYGCSGFTCLTLGDAVTVIGDWAFKECTGLTNVTLGNSIFRIGGEAFSGCTCLTSLTIGKSVTNLFNMIENCPNLTSLSVESGNPVYDSRDNCNAIIHTATNTLLVGCPATVIPNTVTSIGDNAFFYCSGLTSMTIPNSVTSIGCWSFYGCKDLTTVYIPNSVTSIGVETHYSVHNNDTTIYYDYYNPFQGCSSLSTMNVESGNPVFDSRDNCNAIIETATNTLKFGCYTTVIPNTVTIIGDDSFAYCENLTSIDIPNSVTTIGDNAFCGSGLKSFDIPNSVTSIGDYAFGACVSLKDIHIPNSVTSIGDYAFGACVSLKEVTIPNSLIASERYTATGWFQQCWSLERVTIGSGIAYMGVMFWKCPNITSVTCLGTVPPGYDIYYSAQNHENVYNFDDVVYGQATLYVPISALDAYKTAAYWKNFQDIRPLGDADGDGIVGVADVTRIIDYLQSGSGNGFDIGAADTDGDGNVTIGDVTKLIDAILNQRSV